MESQALALIDNNAKHQRSPPGASPDIVPSSAQLRRAFPVMNIATISSGFEKGDCELVCAGLVIYSCQFASGHTLSSPNFGS